MAKNGWLVGWCMVYVYVCVCCLLIIIAKAYNKQKHGLKFAQKHIAGKQTHFFCRTNTQNCPKEIAKSCFLIDMSDEMHIQEFQLMYSPATLGLIIAHIFSC